MEGKATPHEPDRRLGLNQFDPNLVALIRAANIRLRFDKVAMRLMTTLQASLANAIPSGQAVILTVTAPIKHPAKTAAELEVFIREDQMLTDGRRLICGNSVGVRCLTNIAVTKPKLLCFVHNEPSDAERILTLAETSLSG
jgi:hypothetical protein